MCRRLQGYTQVFDPCHLPLINTLILLLSGCAVTWAHHALVHNGDRKALIQGLAIGIALGVAFTGLQAYEYALLLLHDGWTFGNDIFFSNFFMATGFHGFHVLIGTIFLIVCLIRAMKGDFTAEPSMWDSRPPPGTGTSWMWSGCSCFFAVYSGECRVSARNFGTR